MQKTVLDEVYDLLKNIGAVDNESKIAYSRASILV